MKKIVITLLLLMPVITTFSQDLSFDIHGKYSHAIHQENLVKSEFMKDIIPYFPENWISSYVSVKIQATLDGKSMIAMGKSDTLSTEQKKILNMAELGTEIVINILYEYKNPVTGNIDNGEMNYSTTVIPEIEAEYTGGQQQLKQYIEMNAMNKIPEATFNQSQQAKIVFTVNEEGAIADPQVSLASGHPEIDQLLLETISKMPRWKPAEDSAGRKVKQKFEFSVGIAGC